MPALNHNGSVAIVQALDHIPETKQVVSCRHGVLYGTVVTLQALLACLWSVAGRGIPQPAGPARHPKIAVIAGFQHVLCQIFQRLGFALLFEAMQSCLPTSIEESNRRKRRRKKHEASDSQSILLVPVGAATPTIYRLQDMSEIQSGA